MDAIHYKIRQEGQVISKAAYGFIGIDLDGYKDVLGILIGKSESARFWLGQAIAASFPKTQIQKCIVHQIRNSTKYEANKDLKEFTSDLKVVYKAVNEAQTLKILDALEEKWGRKYPLSRMYSKLCKWQ